MSGVV